MVLLPRMLAGHDRRRHVRQTIREDHRERIMNGSAEAQAKFDKLSGSLYSFFRGTCLLFYRDMAGEDAWMPTVLALGDVHPENFGVMPSHDDVPMFGVNDFDEAYYAPFTWDLKRGAVGFVLAADEVGAHGTGRQAKIVRRFVRGYIAEMRRYATGDQEPAQMRMDNAPELIVDLIEDSLKSRSGWLAKKYLDEQRRGFRATDEHVPITSRRDEFQEIVDDWVQSNAIDVPARAGEMRVKDVCKRLGQGTASLGLPRYYVLIEGPAKNGTDDLIIEFKQARRSALAGLVPPSPFRADGRAERIRHAQGVQLVRADRFYGATEIDGISFMSRERAPYRNAIDLDDLSKSEWMAYAEICGASLASAHAGSDDAGQLDYDVEPAIIEAIGDEELFIADVVEFAAETSERMRRDHQAFREDHARGAFSRIDRVFI